MEEKESNVPAHPRGGSGGGAADTKVARAGEEGSANTTGLGVIDNQPASGTRVAAGRVGIGGDGSGGVVPPGARDAEVRTRPQRRMRGRWPPLPAPRRRCICAASYLDQS
jgi:hypothetical protein